MPRFKCQNEQCSNFDKEPEFYPRINYIWNSGLLRFECEHSFCPVCGEFREPIKEYAGFTEAWFKAESNRNYNNKTVKQYDWDRNVIKNTTVEVGRRRKQ